MKTKKHIRNCFCGIFLKKLSVLIIIPMILISTSTRAQNKKPDLIITTLYDNSSSNKELKTGFGFSCLIQGAEKTILFDVGHADAVANMDTLKIDPASIDAVVISHAHWDHTDGLPYFLKRNRHAKIFNVPNNSVKICKNIYTTGAMAPDNPYMGIMENALIIRTSKGLVIITGCAHPGIVKIVQKAKSMFPKDPVYLVMGGFHLLNESSENVKKTVAVLRKEKVQKIAPSHCTGDMAESVFKEMYKADFIAGDVGKPIIIKNAFKNK